MLYKQGLYHFILRLIGRNFTYEDMAVALVFPLHMCPIPQVVPHLYPHIPAKQTIP